MKQHTFSESIDNYIKNKVINNITHKYHSVSCFGTAHDYDAVKDFYHFDIIFRSEYFNEKSFFEKVIRTSIDTVVEDGYYLTTDDCLFRYDCDEIPDEFDDCYHLITGYKTIMMGDNDYDMYTSVAITNEDFKNLEWINKKEISKIRDVIDGLYDDYCVLCFCNVSEDSFGLIKKNKLQIKKQNGLIKIDDMIDINASDAIMFYLLSSPDMFFNSETHVKYATHNSKEYFIGHTHTYSNTTDATFFKHEIGKEFKKHMTNIKILSD